MMKPCNRASLLASCSILFAVTAGQSAQAQVFEEIVVTAQKRDQSLSDVAVSVTAFSGESLRKFGFTSSVDIAAQVPGLNIGTPVGEGNNPSFTLRGVGLNDFNDNNEAPIAIYQDGVYMAALPGLTFQLFDTERVEVLRGPQGTLYGRNATGGLIHFIAKKPTEEFEAFGQVTYGSHNELSFEGAVSGPFSDSVRGRLSFARKSYDGYVKNRIGKDANEADSYALRGQLDFSVGETGSLLLKGNYASSNTIAPQYQHEASDGVADIYGYNDTDGDNFAGDYNREGVLDIESYGGSATYKGLIGNIDITNIFSYSKTEKLHEEDTDVGPFSGVQPTFASNIKVLTEALTLSGTPSLATADPDTLLPAILYDVNYEQNTQSISGYGQVEYALSEAVKLTGGLRYSNEDKDMEYLNAMPDGYLLNDAFGGILGMQSWMDFRTGANNNATGIPDLDAGVVGGLNNIDGSNLSGKIGIDYTPNDNTLLYASVSRGFKSGGFNAGFSDATDGIKTSQIPYDEEILTSYEAGIKWSSESGKISVNAAAFYYDYKDFQALTFQGLSQVITNSDATYKGAEIEIGARPTDGLSMQLAASLLDANVEGVSVNGEFLADRRPVLAPKFTASGFIQYEKPVAALKGFLSGNMSFNHQGAHYFDITNSPQSHENAYTLVDARIAYRNEAGTIELAGFVKNLFNTDHRVYTFDFGAIAGFNQQFYGKPRWFGIQLTLRN